MTVTEKKTLSCEHNFCNICVDKWFKICIKKYRETCRITERLRLRRD